MALPSAIEESMLQEVELEALAVPEEECKATRPRKGRGFAVAKVIAAVALLVTVIANVHSLPRKRVGKLREFDQRGVTILTADKKSDDAKEDPCEDEPQLIMNKVLHNNLGKQGPGTGKEGMVLEGTYKRPDGRSQDVELHLNVAESSEPFQVGDKGSMGLHGKFMSINMKPGTEVTIDMKVTEPGETDPLTLPVLDMSFFDLDKHKEGNAEYVEVNDFYSYLTYENTEIKVHEVQATDKSYWTKFQATEVGTGEDNPTDPLDLTEQQLNRAFSVEFLDFTTGKFTLGNLKPTNTHLRRFDFIGKPALKCARGVDHEKVSMHVKANPQCCIVKIMSFGLVCVDEKDKQFYHFMCDPVETE